MCRSSLFTMHYSLLSNFTLSHSGIHKILCSMRFMHYDCMHYEIVYCTKYVKDSIRESVPILCTPPFTRSCSTRSTERLTAHWPTSNYSSRASWHPSVSPRRPPNPRSASTSVNTIAVRQRRGWITNGWSRILFAALIPWSMFSWLFVVLHGVSPHCTDQQNL